jgi:endonuclease YncB( thermonuclease family)
VIAAVAVAAGCGSSGASDPTVAVVAREGDGDTVDLRSGQRVRLVQIDAPELGDGECYGRASLRELEELAPPGTEVELEHDSGLDDTDRFGRLLRYVRSDGTNLNVELVRRGAATPYFFRGERGRYADELLAAVEDARSERLGMWRSCRVVWSPNAQVTTSPR